MLSKLTRFCLTGLGLRRITAGVAGPHLSGMPITATNPVLGAGRCTAFRRFGEGRSAYCVL